MKNERMDLEKWHELKFESMMIEMRVGEKNFNFIFSGVEYYMMMPVIYCKYSAQVIFFCECEFCGAHLLDFEYDCCRSCSAPVEM